MLFRVHNLVLIPVRTVKNHILTPLEQVSMLRFLISKDLHQFQGIWVRDNTAKLFNAGRKPQPFCDVISEPADPSTNPSACKILVMLHNWFYTITVYRLLSSSSPPQLLEPGEIESQLRAIVLDVERRLANGEKAVPIGILSADERDRWTDVQSRFIGALKSYSPPM